MIGAVFGVLVAMIGEHRQSQDIATQNQDEVKSDHDQIQDDAFDNAAVNAKVVTLTQKAAKLCKFATEVTSLYEAEASLEPVIKDQK